MAFGKLKPNNNNLMVIIIGLLIVLIFLVVLTSVPFSFSFINMEETQTETGKVIMTADIAKTLNFLYESLSAEYAGCLYGTTAGNETRINKFQETKIVSRTEGDITFMQCSSSGDFLGTLHSHPVPTDNRFVASCGLSRADVFSLAESNERMSCIICGIDKMKCYNRENLDNGIIVEVK